MQFNLPKTKEEAISLLNSNENVKLLAGGTDLLLEIKRDKINPDVIISLDRIPQLHSIIENEDEISIGSMVSFQELRNNHLIKKYFNSIYESARTMGSPQIRNMATIGGNLMNAGAAADMTPCIMSLDGILVFESSLGIRRVNCVDYYQKYNEMKVKPNELLTHVICRKENAFTGFYKLGKRNSLAIARINAAVKVKVEDEKISQLTLSLGAVGKYPFRVNALEEKANGQKVEWLMSEEPLQIVENAVYESIKGRKTMPFKKEAIKGVYRLALKNALEGKGSND